MKDIKELTYNQLASWLQTQGIESYRAGQIFRWIYLRQTDDFEMMSDLGRPLRSLLGNHFTIGRLERARTETSEDGSEKYLFRLQDGSFIESVLIPEKNHYTLCISSQVGCPLGCRFCLTAKNGLVRNLTQGEIIAQARDIRKAIGESGRLSNIVFMGMGEPLLNYRNVIRAIRMLTSSEYGLQFSNRRVTISTSGIIPRLRDLGQDTKVSLAVSLNAVDDRTRSMLMPMNRKYPLKELIDACRVYPSPPRRRITFEYILIRGINDSPRDAEQLARLLRPVKSKINLIPFNEHEGSDFRRPDDQVIQVFKDILDRHHHTAMIRKSKGRDISAACGQLNAQNRKKQVL